MFEAEYREALAAVEAAARLCRSVREQANPETLHKGDRSPVTVADFGSQALVCRHLKAHFPQDSIVGEENADALRTVEQKETLDIVTAHVAQQIGEATTEEVLDWIDAGGDREGQHRFWTLDPIDGTKGFLRGDQYAVALALVVDGEPVVGALACPNLGPSGTLAWAVKGQGAWAADLNDGVGARRPLSVSTESDPEKVRFCESVESGHSSHSDSARIAAQLGIAGEPVRMDSQVKYAAVAMGAAEIYMRLPTRPGYIEKIWDHAAGSIVVQEAGGRVTDVSGAGLDFSRGHVLEANTGVIVSNGGLHDGLLDAIGELGIGR